jgi:hypothetical protein
MEKGPVMNTGPDKVGRGRKRLGWAVPWRRRGGTGRAVVVLIRLRVRTCELRTQRCEPRKNV